MKHEKAARGRPFFGLFIASRRRSSLLTFFRLFWAPSCRPCSACPPLLLRFRGATRLVLRETGATGRSTNKGQGGSGENQFTASDRSPFLRVFLPARFNGTGPRPFRCQDQMP